MTNEIFNDSGRTPPLTPEVAKRALNLLSDQISELEDRNRDLAGAIRVLAEAIRDIGIIAHDYNDYDRDDLNRIIRLCESGGIRTAMGYA